MEYEDFADLIPEPNTTLLSDNHDWFISRRERLMHWYRGMYIVIYKRHVIATFRDGEDAENWVKQVRLEGEASVYRCVMTDDYSQTLTPKVYAQNDNGVYDRIR